MEPLKDADIKDDHFGDQIRTAVYWRSGSQIVSQILTWSSTLIVVRLLDPSDYGLFAMSQVVLSLLSFLNGYGIVSALVQSPRLEEKQIRQAFGLMLVLNGALAIAQLLLAGIAADYYRQPVVATMLQVQALIYVSTPFITLPGVLISRSLSFKGPAIISILTAVVTAVVSLVGALLGWGVWTLVIAPIVGYWVRGVGNMIVTRFLYWPSFDFRGTGHIIKFGAFLFGSQLLFMVQTQADIMIGGHVLSPHELGLYSEAVFLSYIIVSRFIPPLNEVAFPVYARMQDNKEMLRDAFCKTVRLILLVACPLYLGLAAVALPAVHLLFGPKWLNMAPLVTILTMMMPFYVLQVLFSPALNAIGRPNLTARISAVGAALLPLGFLIGVQWGAIGMAISWACTVPLFTLITVKIAAPLLNVTMADLGRALLPTLGASIPMVLVVKLTAMVLPPLSAPLTLAIVVPLGAAVYVGMLYLFWRKSLIELALLLRNRSMTEPEEPRETGAAALS